MLFTSPVTPRPIMLLQPPAVSNGATRAKVAVHNVTTAVEDRTSMFHSSLSVQAVAAAASLVIHGSLAPCAQAAEHSWQPCPNGQQCVSTNSFMQPAQYLPAWLYQPDTQQTALRSLLDELSVRQAELLEVDEADGYVAARVRFGSGDKEVDTLQFRIMGDGVVLFKSQADANRPYPPFCFVPGCISGPGNRQRLESLRDDLGWTVLEPDEDKKWVQILLH